MYSNITRAYSGDSCIFPKFSSSRSANFSFVLQGDNVCEWNAIGNGDAPKFSDPDELFSGDEFSWSLRDGKGLRGDESADEAGDSDFLLGLWKYEYVQ